MVRPGDGDEWLRLNGAGENLTWAAADFENFAEPRPELAADYEAEFEKAVRLLHRRTAGASGCTPPTTRPSAATWPSSRSSPRRGCSRAGTGGCSTTRRPSRPTASTASPPSAARMSVQNRMSFQGEAFVRRYGPGAAAHAPPVRRDAGPRA